MTRIWKILTWSPFGKRPWYFHAFNCMWVWATVLLLMLSMPSWLGHTVAIGDATPDESNAEVDLFDYNSPIALADGRCMVVKTREIVEC